MSNVHSPLVLTFDIGTQSLRAILVKTDGSFADLEQYQYETPYISKQEGWAEQEPDFYYECMMQASGRLLERNKDLLSDLIAVTVTVFRDSAVFLDENNRPLRNIILWMDQRKAEYNGEFSRADRLLFSIVGMYDTAKMQYELTPANWVRIHEPQVWEKTKKYVMLPVYLNYRLTGVLKDSAADMTGHVPMDYKNRRWLGKKGINARVLRVPLEMMPEICRCGDIIGTITDQVHRDSKIPAGLPVIAGAPDKCCETLGLGVNEEGLAAVSLGTAATIDIAVDHYCSPYPFLPSYPAVDETKWNPELQIYRGFWMLKWFISNFAEKQADEAEKEGISAEEYMNRYLHEVPAGCGGLLLDPYWQPGVEHPRARGVMTGFTDHVSQKTVYRAVIEGIGLALRKGMENLEHRCRSRVHEIRIAGGGSKSDEICQIMADIFHLPVVRTATDESSGVGAAMNVFVSQKIYPDFKSAVEKMVHVKDVFIPDEKNAAVYEKLFAIYRDLYKRIEPINARLGSL